jgi:hypothetical protein
MAKNQISPDADFLVADVMLFPFHANSTIWGYLTIKEGGYGDIRLSKNGDNGMIWDNIGWC